MRDSSGTKASLVIAVLIVLSYPTFAQSELPLFQDLSEGWNTLEPGGETACAHGADFEFYVRQGSTSDVLVYLYGGGGCWDAEGCVEGSVFYTQDIRPNGHPSGMNGIFDLESPDNPFAGFTMVAVPVCTGDVHLGHNDATYVLEREGEEPLEFVVRHRGQVNAGSAVLWVIENMPDAHRVAVLGSSAGALGVPFHASILAQALPQASVVGLGDDAGAYGAEVMGDARPENWGFPDVLRSHAGWGEAEARLGVEGMYSIGATSAPNLRLFQFDHAHDRVQHFFLERAGTSGADVKALIEANRVVIRSSAPDFRGFMLAGYPHTILRHPAFYMVSSDGVLLRDWVHAIVTGADVEDVRCTSCSEPDFVFVHSDGQIIERMLDLLTPEAAWNREDPGGACPGEAESYSLRCAVAQAARDVSDLAVGSHAVAWAVAYATAARVPYHREGWSPMVRFNNDPETSHADVLELLGTIAERVAATLAVEAVSHESE